jgi:spore germination protein GerM
VQRKNKQKSNMAKTFLVWFIAFFVIIVAFAFNMGRIQKVLDDTKFVETVFGTPEDKSAKDVVRSRPDAGEGIPALETVKAEIEPIVESTTDKEDLTLVTEAEVVPPPPQEEVTPIETPVNTEVLPNNAKTQKVKLCFLIIEKDGILVRQPVDRRILQTEAPLTGAIKSLLNGPDLADVDNNLVSLIPSGSELLSAYVEDGVAFLNFNDAFQFNPYGADGYRGQLMQVVFTATEFPSIKSVQILIEDKIVGYLGSDGAWVGRPLARANF